MRMKLSIIVPVYNVEPYLHRCVDSILAQTFRDFEVILVDDGSTDESGKICDVYGEADPRVRVIHKKNGGQSDARNVGLDIAQGEYIGFVDSDDFIAPEMYEEMMKVMIKTNADIVGCGYENVDNNSLSLGIWPEQKGCRQYERQEFIENFFPDTARSIGDIIWNKLYRRKVFNKIRFPVGRIYEDSFVTLATFSECHKIVMLSEPYCKHFIRSGSTINSKYSDKSFCQIDVALTQYKFFVEHELKEQKEFALCRYVDYYLFHFLAVYIAYPQYTKVFQPYRKEFKNMLSKILGNPKTCRMKKVMVLTTYVNKKMAYRICVKYFPECLPRFMRQQ